MTQLKFQSLRFLTYTLSGFLWGFLALGVDFVPLRETNTLLILVISSIIGLIMGYSFEFLHKTSILWTFILSPFILVIATGLFLLVFELRNRGINNANYNGILFIMIALLIPPYLSLSLLTTGNYLLVRKLFYSSIIQKNESDS